MLDSPSVWTPSRWLQAQLASLLAHDTRTILAALAALRSDLMATLQQFQDALAAIDAETTRIGTVMTDLLAKLAAGGLTAAEEQTVLDSLTAEAARLKLVDRGADQPVPPPAPPVV